MIEAPKPCFTNGFPFLLVVGGKPADRKTLFYQCFSISFGRKIYFQEMDLRGPQGKEIDISIPLANLARNGKIHFLEEIDFSISSKKWEIPFLGRN